MKAEMTKVNKLRQKLDEARAIVCIIGLGYVGLPFSFSLDSDKMRNKGGA